MFTKFTPKIRNLFENIPKKFDLKIKIKKKSLFTALLYIVNNKTLRH